MGSCELVSVCVRVRVCVGHQLLWLLQLAGYKLQAMKAPRLSCGESFFLTLLANQLGGFKLCLAAGQRLIYLISLTDRPNEPSFK